MAIQFLNTTFVQEPIQNIKDLSTLGIGNFLAKLIQQCRLLETLEASMEDKMKFFERPPPEMHNLLLINQC